jgi:AsmA protein
MNKPLKYSLIGIAGLLFLVIAAAAIFVPHLRRQPLQAPDRAPGPGKDRPDPQAAGAAGGRRLASLGAKVSGVTFSERGSDQQFLALDNAHASVALMPLLRGQVVVDRIRISGFKANIVKQKDGKFNFSDLLEAKRRSPPPRKKNLRKKDDGGGAPVAIDLAGVDIDKSSIAYRDLSTGKEYSVSDFKLGTGRIADRADGKLQMHAAIKAPDLDIKLDLGADYKLDLPAESVALDKLDLKVSGKEEPHLKGRVALAKSKTTFDLDIDKLNVGRLPAGRAEARCQGGRGREACGEEAGRGPRPSTFRR